MGTVNGTQTLGKIPLSLETIYDSFKIYSSLYFAYDVHLGTNQEFHSFVNFNECTTAMPTLPDYPGVSRLQTESPGLLYR